jgi:ubiquinone/menaquinone biosynthesis C-methylase UbiE
MARRPAEYVPAAGHDLFLPLYDPMLRLLMRERAFRQRFLAQADIHPRHRVLDVGCGTGTMAILVCQGVPEVTVVGVDGDPKALAIARRKAAKASVTIRFDEALADHLPYADASFDRVLSSLVLHHLTHADKLAALREIRRVLAPGGSFHLADFGAPIGLYAKVVSHLLGHWEQLGDNLQGRLSDLLREAGLADVQERGHHNTLVGTLALLSASA